MARRKSNITFSQQKIRGLQREAVERSLSQPASFACAVFSSADPNTLIVTFAQDMDTDVAPNVSAFNQGMVAIGSVWGNRRVLALTFPDPVTESRLHVTADNGLRSAAYLGGVGIAAALVLVMQVN